ncbi:MAG TPA: DUF4214 domain-containing protein [Pirellulales bacterium]|nr:DUF4214 domain-containing protein [Pirellulales bacterium]
MQFFKHWPNSVKKDRRSTHRRPYRTTLGIQTLEDRRLFSISPVAPPATEANPGQIEPTSMTGLAQQQQQDGQLPLPSGPTTIYLNFDGWNDCPYDGNKDVAPYEADATTIQDILYRASEVFAPFDVRVLQMTGNGAISQEPGATTIFINPTFNHYDFTPSASSDYPSTSNPNGGTSHILNSDPSGDVAFVCPDTAGDEVTASGIAHEAGHTFGLVHVRTDGQSDFTNGTFNPVTWNDDLPIDVMSYDSPNDFFSNTDFNVTIANNDGTSVQPSPGLAPNYEGEAITTQNSFTYLETVLGARPATSHIAVVDQGQFFDGRTKNTVDPTFFNDTPSVQPVIIGESASVSGTLQEGDYDAYEFRAASSPSQQSVSVAETGGIDQKYLILDMTNGGDPVAFSDEGYVDFQANASDTYAIVVSCRPGEPGAFSFNVGSGVGVSLSGRDFTVTNANQQITGHLVITGQTGATVTGTFTPHDGSNVSVPISGHVGPAVDAITGLIFSGTEDDSQYIHNEPDTDDVSIDNFRKVNFIGHVSLQPRLMPIEDALSGNGTYAVTATTTTYDAHGHSNYHNSRVTETLSFVSGSARFVNNTTVDGTTDTMTDSTNGLPPTAASDTFVLGATGPYQTAATTGVLANDVSADGQPLTASLVSSTSHGSLTLNADGSFSYTPDATFKGLDRFTYQAGENGLEGQTVTVTLLSYHASLVDKLYQQVLHRPAEDDGLVYWASQLDAGQPLDVVAQGIFNSVERLDPLVEQFYQQYLGRGTDSSGLAWWAQDWQAKGDPRDVVDNLLASQEFFDDAGETDSGYIDLLYQRVLQRPADQNGLEYWVGQMSSSANESRLQIASQFYDTHEKHVATVDFLFGEYFQGASPLPDATPYVTDLDNGQSETQVETAIIDSSAYGEFPPEPATGAVGRALYAR